jgi:hypothetical protein
MTRGGARLNAGAKAKWKHGKTKTIRVPEVLVPQILEYSKKLDGESNIEKVTQSKTVPGITGTGLLVIDNTLNLSNISIHRFKNRSFVFIEDLIKAGYEIQPSKLAAIVLDEMYKSQIKGANRSNGS